MIKVMNLEIRTIKEFQALILVDSKPVSYGYLIVHPHKEGNPHGIIEEVFTEPEHRHKGYATEVISKLIEFARSEGCYKVVLECSDENMKLYSKLGFTKHQNAMRLSL